MRVKVLDQPGRGKIDQKHFYYYLEQLVTPAKENDYDVLFLGPYHTRMPENWEEVFKLNRDRLLVIGTGDDTDFLAEDGDIPYSICPNVLLVTPYDYKGLMSEYAESKGWTCHVMPFSLCPDLMPYFGGFKDIDICMVMDFEEKCEHHKTRRIVKSLIEVWGILHDMVTVTGSDFETYFETLARSKVFITDGSGRKSMTCKYLEAYFYGCVLIGDKPLYPEGLVPDDGDYSKFFGDQWVRQLVEKMEEFR